MARPGRATLAGRGGASLARKLANPPPLDVPRQGSSLLVDGEPPTIVGGIDFALTHREAPIADLAFGLWRSGRPEPQALVVDPARVAAVVAGYISRRALPAGTVQALPTYLKARGLQLIIRATRAGAVDCSVQLERVGVIAAQQDELEVVLNRLV